MARSDRDRPVGRGARHGDLRHAVGGAVVGEVVEEGHLRAARARDRAGLGRIGPHGVDRAAREGRHDSGQEEEGDRAHQGTPRGWLADYALFEQYRGPRTTRAASDRQRACYLRATTMRRAADEDPMSELGIFEAMYS